MSDLQRNLLSKRVIDICGETDRKMLIYVREAIIKLSAEGCPPIEVLFSSEGGSNYYGLMIYDLFANYPGHITGTVITEALSMAGVILQACDKRQAHKHSRFLVHNPRNENFGWDDLNEQERFDQLFGGMTESRNFIIDIYKKRTKRKASEIKLEMGTEDDMNAQKALEFGLIDRILTPRRKKPRGGK